MALICGIEEAGRGPVIGPLVMCGLLATEEEIELLTKIDVRDSKLLAPKKREELAKKIKNIVKKSRIIIVPPAEIDDAVESDTLNLNWLEAIKSAEIINELKPDIVCLDCPSNNIRAYANYIRKYLKNKKIELNCVHKGESKFRIVAAASIMAKVARDKEIEKIQENIKEDIGSGYPADPITKNFLLKYHDKYPDIFRKSWASYKEVLSEKGQRTLAGFDGFLERK